MSLSRVLVVVAALALGALSVHVLLGGEVLSLSGVVSDAAGRPVPAVWIAREGHRNAAGLPTWERTDVAGRFRFDDLPAGDVLLRVVPGEASLLAGEVVRAQAGTTDLVVVVDPGPQLFARIPGYVPPPKDVTWARLLWSEPDGRRPVRYAPVAPDGRVRFVRLPPDRALELLAVAGAERVVRVFDLRAGETEVEVATQPAQTIRGRAEAEGGLDRVEVSAEAYPGVRVGKAILAPDGTFTVSGLPAGTYRVKAGRTSGAVTVPVWREAAAGATDVVLKVGR